MITNSKVRGPRRDCSEQQRERDRAGDHAAPQQRQVEQQVERDRPADHLGDVGRHGDELGLQPVGAPAPAAADAIAQGLGQAAPGDDAELGREVLDEPGHDVAEHDDPDQQVAVHGARGHVARDVARVEVGDAGDEGGADQPREAGERQPPGRAARAGVIAPLGRCRSRRRRLEIFRHTENLAQSRAPDPTFGKSAIRSDRLPSGSAISRPEPALAWADDRGARRTPSRSSRTGSVRGRAARRRGPTTRGTTRSCSRTATRATSSTATGTGRWTRSSPISMSGGIRSMSRSRTGSTTPTSGRSCAAPTRSSPPRCTSSGAGAGTAAARWSPTATSTCGTTKTSRPSPRGRMPRPCPILAIDNVPGSVPVDRAELSRSAACCCSGRRARAVARGAGRGIRSRRDHAVRLDPLDQRERRRGRRDVRVVPPLGVIGLAGSADSGDRRHPGGAAHAPAQGREAREHVHAEEREREPREPGGAGRMQRRDAPRGTAGTARG